MNKSIFININIKYCDLFAETKLLLSFYHPNISNKPYKTHRFVINTALWYMIYSHTTYATLSIDSKLATKSDS